MPRLIKNLNNTTNTVAKVTSKYARGFSLLEFLIITAVIAIIASVTIATYSSYAHRSNRELVKQILTQDVVKLEQYYNQTGNYLTSNNSWPYKLIESHLYGTGGLIYTINFTPVVAEPKNSQRFELVAIPVPGSLQDSDGAGNICIDQNGTIAENASTNCWQRGNSWSDDAKLCRNGNVMPPATATCVYNDNCKNAVICGSCASVWYGSDPSRAVGSCSNSYIGGSCSGDCANSYIGGNCVGNCTNSIVCGVCSGSYCSGVTNTGCS